MNYSLHDKSQNLTLNHSVDLILGADAKSDDILYLLVVPQLLIAPQIMILVWGNLYIVYTVH